MKRLRLLIGIFFIALLIPLAYFVLSTYQGLKQEEIAQLRYFAEALFDTMEEELTAIVIREEARSIDDYTAFSSTAVDATPSSTNPALLQDASASYILGYFQNNPDGSFQTPVIEPTNRDGTNKHTVTATLENINTAFNEKRAGTPLFAPSSVPQPKAAPEKETPDMKPSQFADRYLESSRTRKQKEYLGQDKKRVEEITVQQAINLSQSEADSVQDSLQDVLAEGEETNTSASRDAEQKEPLLQGKPQDEFRRQAFPATGAKPIAPGSAEKLQVEVDPLQSVFIDDNHIFVFRRIIVNNRIFRQGFVILTQDFLNHLASAYFAGQPMAQFSNLRLQAVDQDHSVALIHAGINVERPTFALDRSFPRPFSFCAPPSAAKTSPSQSAAQCLML